VTKRTPIAVAIAVSLSAWLVLGMAPAAFAAVVTASAGGFSFSADDANVAAGAQITGYTGPVGAVIIPDTVGIGGTTYNVTSIGPNAFENKGVTSVTIPATVTSIGDQAFLQNDLSTLSLPAGLTSIGSGAFSINSLTTVAIPAGVTDLTFASFDGNNLTSVTFLGSPTTIGQSAFANNEFTSFTIPASVTSIGSSAFIQNTNLTSILFAGAAPTTFTAAAATGSFGTAAGKTVSFHWAFGSPQAAGGFTTPTWNGYATSAIVTVGFDMQGHGTAPAAQDLVSGGTAVKPSDPTATGQKFTGWFTSAALTTPFDFAAPVTADATAFAGWTSSELAATGTPVSPLVILIAAGVLILGILLLLISRLRRRAVPRG
jgi:uncharacterized repeat protein (TIGR02543 family)